MKLLLLRHGEIPSNIQKTYAGRSCEGLTERGLAQAREAASLLLNQDIDSIYSSPIYRAVQTANIIGKIIRKNVLITEAFREMEMGPWEGMSEEEIAQSYLREWQIWMNRPAELTLPGRETLKELLERVLKGVQCLNQGGIEKSIVIITHVAVIRVLLLWHAGKKLNLYKTIHVPNARIFELNIDKLP